MLHIYISPGQSLDVWVAGSRSFMWFPVPEKRVCGTYWLYMMTAVMKLFRLNCGLRNCSRRSLASAWSKHWHWPLSNTEKHQQSTSSLAAPVSLNTESTKTHFASPWSSSCQSSFSVWRRGIHMTRISCSFCLISLCGEFSGRARRCQPCCLDTGEALVQPPWLLTLKASFHWNPHRLFICPPHPPPPSKKKKHTDDGFGCITYSIRQTNCPLAPVKRHTCTNNLLGMHVLLQETKVLWSWGNQLGCFCSLCKASVGLT